MVVICLLAVFSTPVSGMTDMPISEDQAITIEINEYEFLQSLAQEDISSLRQAGYSEKEIESIKNFEEEYHNHILWINKTFTDSDLIRFGYTVEEIRKIRNYDGSPKSDADLAANLTLTQWCGSGNQKLMYNPGNNTTSITVYYSFQWKRIPFWQYTDRLAYTWGESFASTTNPQINLTYYGPLNSSWNTSVQANVISTDGGYFSLPMNGLTNQYVLNKGNGSVKLTKSGNVSQIPVYFCYAHRIIYPGEISVSIGVPGISINFGVSASFIDRLGNYRMYYQ